jgi:hypothetical protein
VPPLANPDPELATDRVAMGDPSIGELLPYGWFDTEQIGGRDYRWAAVEASVLIRLEAPAKRLRLEFAQVPVDTGGVGVSIRRMGSPDPSTPAWSTHLAWRYIERSVENHAIALPAGDYEVVFSAREGWSDPPFETRSLGFALASMSFEESYEIPCGGLDMASSDVEEQLVTGWFEPEQLGDRSFRWATGRAAAMVSLREPVSSAVLRYCLPPGPIGGLTLTVCRPASRRPLWSTRIDWIDGSWHDARLPLRLAAGDYLVSFDTDDTWSNPGGADRAFSPENRSLGFAISSLSFGETATLAARGDDRGAVPA